MDHQAFFRYVEYVQGLVTKLTNFVFDSWYSVDSEAQELLSWADPSSIRRDWYFRELEHVDPSKEATATINLRNAGLLTMKERYAKYGQDWKEQLSQWKIEQELLQGLDKPVEPVATPDEETIENLLQELKK